MSIPLYARQETIKLALAEGRTEDALRLRGDLYLELLGLIRARETEGAFGGEGVAWANTIEQFELTETLGFE